MGLRSLLQVQVSDAIEADRVFTMLMGDEVERPRPCVSRRTMSESTESARWAQIFLRGFC